jgi:hypothetical protein
MPRNRGYPRHSGYRRERNEWYVEPRWCVHQILDAVEIKGEVLDPCCGGGTIVSICLDRGIPAHGSDYVDRGFGEVRDVFDIAEPMDNVISNVPYSKAELIIRHLLPLVRHKLLLILPLTFWESRKRNKGLHREIPPRFWYPCSDRPSMPPGLMTDQRDRFGALIQPDNKGGTAPYAWFEYEPGYRGPSIMKLMNLRKDAA